jgi:putative CocE/NonD family hydrolase
MRETDTRAARNVTVEFDVPARMRDGVTLRANVYRPEGEGPWPTLLTRLPYGKDVPELLFWLDPVQTAAKGFMVVVQDTRGRFASEGEWIPLRFEREDGYDSVEWAARLPGSNGRVGMFGLSYLGHTQWAAAVEQPPSLAAIAPSLTWTDPFDGLLARGGAVELGANPNWTLGTGADHLSRLGLSEQEHEHRLAALLDDLDRLPTDGYRDLPVHDLPVMRRHGVPSLDVDSDAVARTRLAGDYERVTVPTLHIGAWHDIFVQAMLDSYTAMTALGRPARLVVGPWTHLTFTDPVGDLCFGARATRDLDDEQLRWFTRYLVPDAAADAGESGAPVRIFVMGRNEWRDEASWPLERARDERWHLHADGALGRDAPGEDAAPTEFTYDPSDPVPTLGGQTVLAPAFPPGPFDQARVEARPDVCVFSSEPLSSDLEVTGRIRVVLHAESSAPSTDWVARLCDVHPDGCSYNLCDGIVRIAEGADVCQQVEIDLWSTSNVFLAGHRLRVHVTSSSFPRWDRNLNTGNQRDPHIEAARQRVHHDADRPSWIELPIVD